MMSMTSSDNGYESSVDCTRIVYLYLILPTFNYLKETKRQELFCFLFLIEDYLKKITKSITEETLRESQYDSRLGL